ncbi:MAG: multidrug resistance efflux transporter family protein [Proteobacteria bacterium]|nr:multidrug resistance efflux transporter family protein [Pseudomonadota bacterium]
MYKLIAIGVLSGLFFSTTFVLNRLMSLQGGHWLWTASLRYFFMVALLLVWFSVTGKNRLLKELLLLYCRNWWFWTLAGTIGFGLFYALITYSASFSPAWVIATTWQTTILATPFVLMGFGKRVPGSALFFSLFIFAGVVLVNVSQAETLPVGEILMGGIPVLVAAFCYPFGNQLVWEVQNSSHRFLPRIDSPALNRPFAKVLLLTLGSLPFWLVLLGIFRPVAPSTSQVLQTATVALFSGIVATGLFLYARQIATNSYELSAVDATQASEVVFALAGEMLFLRALAPNAYGCAGVAMTVLGLCLYIRAQAR